MTDIPVESRAFRQRLMAGLLGFVLGLVALLGVVVYVALLVARQEGWLPAIHLGVHLVIWSVIGAMAIGWLAILLIDRIHARLGWIRCPLCHHCGRRLRHGLLACECNPEWAAILADCKAKQRRYRRHRIERYRKRLPAVAFAWLILLAATYLLHISLRPGHRPSAADLVIGHLLLSGLAALLVALTRDVTQIFKIGKRFRPRAGEFLTLLAIWPIAGGVFMMCRELLR